jgi:hypothetical protein
MSPPQGKTGGMDRDLPDEMPARWLEQIRVLVQDLIGGSAADTHRYFEETRRHFDVVGEGLRADIRAIAEGHVGLVERLDRFQQEVRRDFRRVERRLLRLEVRR